MNCTKFDKPWTGHLCHCDRCEISRKVFIRGADYFDELDHEEAKANQEDWWSESNQQQSGRHLKL